MDVNYLIGFCLSALCGVPLLFATIIWLNHDRWMASLRRQGKIPPKSKRSNTFTEPDREAYKDDLEGLMGLAMMDEFDGD